MKSILIFTLLIIIAVPALAGNSLQSSPVGPVQAHAVDGRLVQTLTGKSHILDATNWVSYGIYCASDAKLRSMPTSAKGSYKQLTVPGGSWYVRGRHIGTPFLNLSTATTNSCEVAPQ